MAKLSPGSPSLEFLVDFHALAVHVVVAAVESNNIAAGKARWFTERPAFSCVDQPAAHLPQCRPRPARRREKSAWRQVRGTSS